MTTATHTYLRDTVPAEKCGQCPCCLRTDIRSSKRGVLVRHGWREIGRQVGQYGCGYQFGECHGTAKRPLETTDADALVILVGLEQEIIKTDEAIEMHTKVGADSYSYANTIDLEYEHDDAQRAEKVKRYATGLKKRGLEFTDHASTKRVEGIRVFFHKTHTFNFAVARDQDATVILYREVTAKGDLRYSKDSTAMSIPSYARLRESTVRSLTDTVKALRRQRDAIKAAIKHHFENPSNGQKDTKRRTGLVHFAQTWVLSADLCRPGATVEQRTRRGLACGKRANTMTGLRMNLAKTEKRDEVTCSKCLIAMEKAESKKSS